MRSLYICSFFYSADIIPLTLNGLLADLFVPIHLLLFNFGARMLLRELYVRIIDTIDAKLLLWRKYCELVRFQPYLEGTQYAPLAPSTIRNVRNLVRSCQDRAIG